MIMNRPSNRRRGVRLRTTCTGLAASALGLLWALQPAVAQGVAPPSPIDRFVTERGGVVAIEHVLLVDGTGGSPRTDQTVVIDRDRIASVGSSRSVRVPPDAHRIDGRGKTLMPGLVGMHEHLFTILPVAGPPAAIEQLSAPALYLAAGVTTARTTGSMDPYGDLEMKRAIDRGVAVGPDLDLSTPYLEGGPVAIGQMHELQGPDDARALIRYWHSLGFTSVKAYADITPAELQAAITEAHGLHMKVTGHLCSVGYHQAIAFGIDNLEHGPFASPDGDLDGKRSPDLCGEAGGPKGQRTIRASVIAGTDPTGKEVAELIRDLVAHKVAITSTLAVLEAGSHLDLAANPRLKALAHPLAWERFNALRAEELKQDATAQAGLRKEMAFERAFVRAGGLLMAGCDPTGDGHAIAGLGDERNIELLVEAGFTVAEAVRVATLNGATFQGLADRTGSVVAGKRADLVLLDGDLARDVRAIEHPLIVFKRGIGFDSAAIWNSYAGQAGLR